METINFMTNSNFTNFNNKLPIMALKILWPGTAPAEVEEIDFSLDFCKRTTRGFLTRETSVIWEEYQESTLPNQLKGSLSSEHLLLVQDPHLVITDLCLQQMLEVSRQTNKAVAPSYNLSEQPLQQIPPPFHYDTVNTFQELSHWQATNTTLAEQLTVEHPDMGCILIPLSLLPDRDDGTESPLPDSLTENTLVNQKALAHRFVHYADIPRPELVALVPESVQYVIDLGCGAGQYGKALKNHRPDIHTIGIERSHHLAQKARKYYAEVLEQDIADFQPNHLKVDLVNCGDIIEHLQNPWKTLDTIYRLLKKGGFLVASIPNASHWSVVRDLIGGTFEYLPAGLLCVGHVRWFTEKSFTTLLEETGFQIESIDRLQPTPSPQGEALIQKLSTLPSHDETALRSHTLIFRARKP
jgi:trans-aconitate methyltransferase